jgi:RES domain-containing protein
VRLSGTVYRAHNPKWAFAPESGAGAARTGGRFNPVGMAALYTSRRFETAWLEAQQGMPFKAQPLTLCAYTVACDDVLDLTDPAIRTANAITPADLACPWKDLATRGVIPPSWHIALRMRAAGIAAIIVPSYASGATTADVNVVFWAWSATPPHQILVIDDDQRLPRDDRSWT